MSEREVIHQYLKSLSKYLSRLDKEDAEEVILEIESHIYDLLDENVRSGQIENIEVILTRFGEPRELAAQYVEHVLTGSPPPEGFKAIQLVKKGVTKGLYYSMALFGYGVSLTLLFLGLQKFLSPDSVGVWSAAGGNSLIVGYVDQPGRPSEELLGFWLVPIAWGLGLLIAFLTRKILMVLKQHS